MAVLESNLQKKKMKNNRLLILCSVVLTFVSCSSDETIDIKYQTDITVTVNQLMSSYKERSSGDFDIADDMNIRIQSYVYDSNGILVDSCISSVNDYSKTISYSVVLENGVYKVVSVADFIVGGIDSPTTKFWETKGINNINTLKISASEYHGSWAWETLGVVVDEFEVRDVPREVSVSILPATALVQIIFEYSNLINGDGTDISTHAPMCAMLHIRSKTQYDMLTDLSSPGFSYYSSAAQQVTYNIMSDNPMETVNNGYARSISYRALLPQEDKSFYCDVEMMNTDGTTQTGYIEETPAKTIEAGKQYELLLCLDALELFLFDVETVKSTDYSDTRFSVGWTTRECWGKRTYKAIDIARTNNLVN